MKVSEVARLSGLSSSAVRFYESSGVLPRAARGANGYRRYGDDDVARLRLVAALRRLGIGPREAGIVASRCLDARVRAGDGPAGDIAPLLAEQRGAIARRRDELDRLEAELADLEETVRAAAASTARPAAADRSPSGGAVTAAAQAPKESSMPSPIRVLFVCTGNSARSQIAEAMLARVGGAEFAAFSAGTDPRGVNPYTVRVLGEQGIDWSMARSKSVAEYVDEPFDYVITVCDRARQACPVFPGEHNTLHWGLEDPAEVAGTEEERLAAFRRTLVDVTNRVRPFVELARRARSAPAAR